MSKHAIAVLVALLMWLCSCEKKSPEFARPYVVYDGEQQLDSLMAKLRKKSTEAYLDSMVPEWREVKSNIIHDKDLTLSEPIIIWPERGDSVYNCKIWLADDFQGEAAFLVVWPKGWDSLTIPISGCTFYSSEVESLQYKNWYNVVTAVSYKAEYKKHVAMVDSICEGKNPCGGSLGFAEYFNQQDASIPHKVYDLWHKNLLITKP